MFEPDTRSRVASANSQKDLEGERLAFDVALDPASTDLVLDACSYRTASAKPAEGELRSHLGAQNWHWSWSSRSTRLQGSGT